MKKGFTLIELMVVVGIIGIMATVTSSANEFFRRKSDLKASSTRALNVIKLARSLAIIAKTDVCVTPNEANEMKYCDDTPPTISLNNTRANLIQVQLSSLMNQKIKLKAGSLTSSGDSKITFNSRGMKSSGSNFLRFTATDPETETVAYFVIEISIAGNTRYCKAESDSENCN